MAQPIYCTNRDVKDVFPHVDEYDTKTPIHGWVVHSGSLYRADNCGLITLLFVDGQDLGDAEANSGVVNANGEWYYDSALDAVYYYNDATNPNDLLMESGEDYSTLLTRFRTNASRYLDGRLDARIRGENWKNRHGEFNYNIIRTTALITAGFLIKANDPENGVADALFEEAETSIAYINSGAIILDDQVTKDSSRGIIKEVSVSGGGLRPVSLRGYYAGNDYDAIKIWVDTTGGVIGTATYSVAVKNSTGLKNTTTIDKETINGQYQLVASGLYVKWAGTNDSAVATVNDEWEIEVYGESMPVNSSAIGTMRMTRR